MAFKENTNILEKTKLKYPKMYKVIFYNDDFTPMDFVVDVLKLVFGKSQTEAYQLMMSVHKSDYAVIGVYTKDIAFTKASTANDMARKEGYPLKVTAVAE